MVMWLLYSFILVNICSISDSRTGLHGVVQILSKGEFALDSFYNLFPIFFLQMKILYLHILYVQNVNNMQTVWMQFQNTWHILFKKNYFVTIDVSSHFVSVRFDIILALLLTIVGFLPHMTHFCCCDFLMLWLTARSR